MHHMIRPQIDLGSDVVEEVERFAEDHGLRNSRAWAELVRAGLRAEADWDDPYVRAYEPRTQRGIVMSMSKADRIRMNEDRLDTFEHHVDAGVDVTPVRCVECGREHPRESMNRRDERGDLLCPPCWNENVVNP